MSTAGAIAIIPARLGSTRFPGKVIAADTGRPMIQHVVERARLAGPIGRVVVAGDDPTIAAALASFNTEFVLTQADHTNGTSRLDEAADLLGLGDDAIVVNVQGDEPEIDPAVIEAGIRALLQSGEPMATVASPFAPGEDPSDPNIVKAVLRDDPDGVKRALLFTRALVPATRDEGVVSGRHDRHAAARGPFKHIGLYAYSRGFLREYAAMGPTPLEQAERLEQLRVLESGRGIAVGVRQTSCTGIDTPEQYAAFVRRWRASTSP